MGGPGSGRPKGSTGGRSHIAQFERQRKQREKGSAPRSAVAFLEKQAGRKPMGQPSLVKSAKKGFGKK
jgi:hypothetical protein